MECRDYRAFVVEGEAREIGIISNIEKVIMKNTNFKIIVLPAKMNLYMLWNRLKQDNFETDIIG